MISAPAKTLATEETLPLAVVKTWAEANIHSWVVSTAHIHCNRRSNSMAEAHCSFQEPARLEGFRNRSRRMLNSVEAKAATSKPPQQAA